MEQLLLFSNCKCCFKRNKSKKLEWIYYKYPNYCVYCEEHLPSINILKRVHFFLKQRERNRNILPYKKIKKNLRKRVKGILKTAKKWDGKKYRRVNNMTGCNNYQLKLHIESQFREGMTWENYGDWHIDHKKPVSLFDLTEDEDLKKVNHYTNLQPLWAIDNLKKGDKYVET